MSHGPIEISGWRWGFWLRVFGYGLAVRDSRDYGLMFSERNGHTKYIQVGRWIVKPLSPVKF